MAVAREQQKVSNSRKLAIGGIVTALSVVLLWLTSVFVFNKLLILVICTMLVAIVVIEFDQKTAWMVYVASSIIGGLVVPNKLMIIYYVALFGNYAIIKQIAESLNKKRWSNFLKGIYFNVILIIMVIVIRLLLGLSFENMIDVNALLDKISNVQLSMEFSIALVIIVYQLAWIIGDRVLSWMIEIYYQRFYKKIF